MSLKRVRFRFHARGSVVKLVGRVLRLILSFHGKNLMHVQ